MPLISAVLVAARRLRTALLVAALAVGGAAVLAGCSAIENLIEQQTGENVDFGGGSVPDDFPEEVPLAEGEVLFGGAIGSGDQRAWNVTIQVGGESAVDDIKEQLESAGFTPTEGVGGSSEQGTLLAYEKAPYHVVVIVGTDGGTGSWTAVYTVTQP